MNNKLIGTEKNIIFYNDEEGNTKIEVLLENEDVWLNTEAIASLFNVDRSGIGRHINNIYKEQELNEDTTCAKIAHVAKSTGQKYETKYYNLDMIISIGFRVNSKKINKNIHNLLNFVNNFVKFQRSIINCNNLLLISAKYM